jgi:hypothetical protein
LDPNYKAAKRVVAHNEDIGCHRPCIGYVTVIGAFNQVLTWSFLCNSESIEELRLCLVALKERHNQAGVKTLVIYVDNCCTVQNKLQEIFPEAKTVLDEHHWMKRWNDIMLDMKSKEAAIFKGCMRRAINVVGDDECTDKKTCLKESRKCKPTVKETLAECNATCPSKEDGRKATNAVVNVFLLADLEKSTLAANAIAIAQAGNEVDLDEAKNAKSKFRSTTIVLKKLADQLKHVPCLMPPPNVVLHHQGANGKIYKAGQSS